MLEYFFLMRMSTEEVGNFFSAMIVKLPYFCLAFELEIRYFLPRQNCQMYLEIKDLSFAPLFWLFFVFFFSSYGSLYIYIIRVKDPGTFFMILYFSFLTFLLVSL